MTFPHLNKAPITEAIVDIQGSFNVDIKPEEIINKFRTLHNKFKNRFPIFEERVSSEIKVSETGHALVTPGFVEGIFFRSANEVVQFRKNGYAFSRLRPYENWNQLIENTKLHWEIFKDSGLEFRINRIATRFINQLSVPYPLPENIEAYLRGIKTPLTEPPEISSLRGFADQVLSIDIPSGASVNHIRVIQEPPKEATEMQVTIDIDVFRMVNKLTTSSDQLWEIIEGFRKVKNKVFFGSIGEEIIKKYKD